LVGAALQDENAAVGRARTPALRVVGGECLVGSDDGGAEEVLGLVIAALGGPGLGEEAEGLGAVLVGEGPTLRQGEEELEIAGGLARQRRASASRTRPRRSRRSTSRRPSMPPRMRVATAKDAKARSRRGGPSAPTRTSLSALPGRSTSVILRASGGIGSVNERTGASPPRKPANAFCARARATSGVVSPATVTKALRGT